MIKKTGLLGIILILLTTAIFAQTKATFEKEGYEITMPAGTVEDKEAEDESEKTFTNQDENVNITFSVIDMEEEDISEEELLRELTEELKDDIPFFNIISKENITVNSTKGVLLKASVKNEEEEEEQESYIFEMSVCVSPDKKHGFILNLLYPEKLKDKYSQYSQIILGSLKKIK